MGNSRSKREDSKLNKAVAAAELELKKLEQKQARLNKSTVYVELCSTIVIEHTVQTIYY